MKERQITDRISSTDHDKSWLSAMAVVWHATQDASILAKVSSVHMSTDSTIVLVSWLAEDLAEGFWLNDMPYLCPAR